MVAQVLDIEAVRAAIRERNAAEAAAEATAALTHYRYVRPLSLAAESLIDFAANPEGRFMLGLHDIDVMTRGFAPGELIYLTGRSHSGKTVVVTNALLRNQDRPIALFTPDETSELVLCKLVALSRGVDAETLELRIKAGDKTAMQMVRDVAAKDFANLVVFDEGLTVAEMSEALTETADYLGAAPACVFVDFMEILPTQGDDVDGIPQLSKAVKRWAKAQAWPTIVLRQNSRSSGKRGQSTGMVGMSYGGENDALCVLEVYRKREDPEMDQFERLRHANTVTVTLAKNKRPPSKLGEVDFYMEPSTGLIRPLRDGDLSLAGVERPPLSAAAAVRGWPVTKGRDW
jgi:replicative DNA helicase